MLYWNITLSSDGENFRGESNTLRFFFFSYNERIQEIKGGVLGFGGKVWSLFVSSEL